MSGKIRKEEERMVIKEKTGGDDWQLRGTQSTSLVALVPSVCLLSVTYLKLKYLFTIMAVGAAQKE